MRVAAGRRKRSLSRASMRSESFVGLKWPTREGRELNQRLVRLFLAGRREVLQLAPVDPNCTM